MLRSGYNFVEGSKKLELIPCNGHQLDHLHLLITKSYHVFLTKAIDKKYFLFVLLDELIKEVVFGLNKIWDL